MADPETDIGLLPQNMFSWFANAPAGSALSQPAMEARRKMALQLMANSGKKGYPKNLGEGLTAIGDALGERGMMNQLAAQEEAYQKRAAAAAAGSIPGEARADAGTGAKTAYASPDDSESNAPVPEAGPVATAAPATPVTPMDTAAPLTPDEAKAGVSGGGYNPVDAAMDPWIGRSRAIAGIESGGAKDPYATMGAPTRTGDRAYGKYQVMGANIPSWTQAALGTSMTPQQFLADKAAQEATFRNKFGGYADKLGEEGAARAWYGGPGANPNATDLHGRLTVAGYGQDYMKRLLGDQQTNPRDAVAQAMMMRPTAQAVPQPNPTSTGGPTMPPTSPAGQTPIPSTPAPAGGPAQGPPPDQRMAFAGLPPEISQGVSAAPPVPPAIQAVPRAAPQATPPATPQRLEPQQRMPVPQDIPMTEDEKRGYRIRAQGLALGDVGIQKQGEALIEYGNAQRTQQYNANLKDWQDQMAERRARQTAEEAFARTQGTPEHASEVATKAKAADIARRFGGEAPYQQFVADMSKSYDATQQLANTLPTFRQAKQALAQSYTGSGSEVKLDASKMLRMIGVPGDYTPTVATELLQSRMKAIAGGLIKSTVGSQNISDADREFVEKAYSGTIKMEPESLRRLLGIAEDTTIRSINRHNDRLMSVASDPTQDVGLRNQYSVPMQYGDQAVAYLKAHPETASQFDAKFGKGHARAVLTGAGYGG